MNALLAPELQKIVQALHFQPSISVIVPFEPKMTPKQELIHSFKAITHDVEQALEDYPSDMRNIVMLRLRSLIDGLNYYTHKRSLAIFVSPMFEKVLYLDIPVHEKVVVDESFAIREIIHNKKHAQEYLLLLLSHNESCLYHSVGGTLVHILTNTPEAVRDYIRDMPEKVSNFSDLYDIKDIEMNKFLRHFDNTLNLIIKAYPLPIFVSGTERIIGHFKKLTKHGGFIVKYIKGNYLDATIPHLVEIMKPHVFNWQKVKERQVLNFLEDESNKNKLAQGIRAARRAAMDNRGRLLVVEKDYKNNSSAGTEISKVYSRYSYIRDEVDEIIEKVLESGGDVEFVDNGMLKAYGRIALVQFY